MTGTSHLSSRFGRHKAQIRSAVEYSAVLNAKSHETGSQGLNALLPQSQRAAITGQPHQVYLALNRLSLSEIQQFSMPTASWVG